jgi:hypothetical protein
LNGGHQYLGAQIRLEPVDVETRRRFGSRRECPVLRVIAPPRDAQNKLAANHANFAN